MEKESLKMQVEHLKLVEQEARTDERKKIKLTKQEHDKLTDDAVKIRTIEIKEELEKLPFIKALILRNTFMSGEEEDVKDWEEFWKKLIK